MADTSAQRQKRSRAHKQGDHSFCDPARCDGVTVTGVTVTRDVSRCAPKLAARGYRLWQELTASDTSPAQLVLIEEACRIADRLDKLDAQLRGADDAWLRVPASDDYAEVTVCVDRALAEARQQAVALKQILGELRQSQVKKPDAPKVVAAGGVTDLTARIRQRQASS